MSLRISVVGVTRITVLAHGRQLERESAPKRVLCIIATFSTALAVTAIAAPASDPVDQGKAVSIAIFKVKPGQEPDFQKIMKRVAIDSRNDPGNLEYRLQQSMADPHVYVAYVVFRTAEDAKAHVNSEHIQKVLPEVLKMLDGGVDAQSYQFLK